jgi:hypothetical protein
MTPKALHLQPAAAVTACGRFVDSDPEVSL